MGSIPFTCSDEHGHFVSCLELVSFYRHNSSTGRECNGITGFSLIASIAVFLGPDYLAFHTAGGGNSNLNRCGPLGISRIANRLKV
jgi:hypothetical protein